MNSKVQFNNVLCPVCKEECHNTWGLVEHMKDRHGYGRMPGGNGHGRIVAAVLAIVVAVSLTLPAKAQPVVAVEHKLFLPFIAAPEDGPEGQGRYWGGSAGKAQPDVSWRPSGS